MSRNSALSTPHSALHLPARLLEPRDLAGQGQLAEHDAGDLELPQEPAAAAGQLAPVVAPGRAGVPRQVTQGGVVLFLLELPPLFGEPDDQFSPTLLLRYPGFGCHSRCPAGPVRALVAARVLPAFLRFGTEREAE